MLRPALVADADPLAPTSPTNAPITGVYVHIPFCLRKCAYCDFVSYAGCQTLIPDYVQALSLEISLRAPAWRGTTFDTLYLGGGTPSLLSPEDLDTLVGALRHYLSFADEIEFTLEANPGTLDMPQARRLCARWCNAAQPGGAELV